MRLDKLRRYLNYHITGNEIFVMGMLAVGAAISVFVSVMYLLQLRK